MRTTRHGITAAAALALAALAAPAQAAGPDDPQALEARAEQLAQQMTGFEEAAKLYRKAAAERAEGDPIAVWDLARAGRLAWYSGDRREAIRDLERAATTAHEYGDVRTAAEAFLDAAWMANEIGEGERAVRLARRGHRLAQSPLLDPVLRTQLQSRVAVAEP